MGIKWSQDPDETLDYTFDWSLMLVGADVIARAHFTSGLEILSETWTDTLATVWLLGGAAGTRYMVTCHMTTAEGREYDRTATIVMKEK